MSSYRLQFLGYICSATLIFGYHTGVYPLEYDHRELKGFTPTSHKELAHEMECF